MMNVPNFQLETCSFSLSLVVIETWKPKKHFSTKWVLDEPFLWIWWSENSPFSAEWLWLWLESRVNGVWSEEWKNPITKCELYVCFPTSRARSVHDDEQFLFCYICHVLVVFSGSWENGEKSSKDTRDESNGKFEKTSQLPTQPCQRSNHSILAVRHFYHRETIWNKCNCTMKTTCRFFIQHIILRQCSQFTMSRPIDLLVTHSFTHSIYVFLTSHITRRAWVGAMRRSEITKCK